VKDAIEEDNCLLGVKQVITSMKNSKLVVLSTSIPQNILGKIHESAKNEKVPTLDFTGSSVTLGRLCGVQFRVSAVSVTSLSDTNLKSIIRESKEQVEQ
ncbi:MAG: ribosomal L7Ae/L30e/S12e/Gadd45 family protein, partial [Nitrosopumilaceae archaeon]